MAGGRRVSTQVVVGAVALSLTIWLALSQRRSDPDELPSAGSIQLMGSLSSDTRTVPFATTLATNPPSPTVLADTDSPTKLPPPAASSISIATLKDVLDRSMAKNGAVYVGHQLVSSPSNDGGIASFVYRDDESLALSLDELAEISARASAKQDEGSRLMEEARREGDHDKMRAAARVQIDGDRELVQEDNYMTVELSTTKQNPPVLMFQRGLPDWVIYSHAGEALAAQALSGEGKLVEVTRSVPGAPTILVYEDSAGNTAYVDPMNGQLFTSRQLVPAPERSRNARDAEEMKERGTRVDQQWSEFLKDGIDMSQFSLDDLRDVSKER